MLNFIVVSLTFFNNETKWLNGILSGFICWQRYFYNGQFFSGNGPMYVYVGGSENAEGYITFMKSGLMYDMATQNNGYMFILEHRGFGQSNVAS